MCARLWLVGTTVTYLPCAAYQPANETLAVTLHCVDVTNTAKKLVGEREYLRLDREHAVRELDTRIAPPAVENVERFLAGMGVAEPRAAKAALAYAGMSVGDFCESQNVTRTHLHLVLSGERESAKLTAAIDRFIYEHTPQKVA